jgi:2-desacetyl-2-hydroxyethyl bacteriochlorophyllide A dehydrogenase
MIMQGLVYEGPRMMQLREVPLPDLADGEVLVRVKATGICGSDLHGYTGKSGRRLPPMIMGHEFAGVVEDMKGVSGAWRMGERVVAQPTIFCGACEYCRRGQTNLCEHKKLFGVMNVNGSMATFLNVPEQLLYRLPDTVSFAHGAMIEPLAVASAAAAKVDVEGRDVLIVGAGTIGLLLLQVVVLAKPRRCIVVDVNRARLDLAGKLGATYALDSSDGTVPESIDRITEGKGVGVAFEAVGITPTVQAALAPLCKEGVCVWIGNSERMVTLNMQDVVTKAQRILGTYAYTHEEFGRALGMAAAGRISLDPLISSVVPLAEGPEMFRLQTENPGSLIKVILSDGD